jgi:peptidoglycan/xylan/chitin deacetylase (PgdA/CDA1 family)
MPHRLYPLCPPLALELIVLMHQIRVLFITNHPPRQIPFILLRLSTHPNGKYVVGNILANSSSNKVVMINFDDGYKSQLIYGKPILNKYGFKASFFIVCGKVATQPYWMNWQDIGNSNLSL